MKRRGIIHSGRTKGKKESKKKRGTRGLDMDWGCFKWAGKTFASWDQFQEQDSIVPLENARNCRLHSIGKVRQ